jgi:hypothetical protein
MKRRLNSLLICLVSLSCINTACSRIGDLQSTKQTVTAFVLMNHRGVRQLIPQWLHLKMNTICLPPNQADIFIQQI